MKKATGTIGFLPVLIVVLIFLKWTEVITWPWWLILLPLWGSVLFGICYGLVYFFLLVFRDIAKRREAVKEFKELK